MLQIFPEALPGTGTLAEEAFSWAALEHGVLQHTVGNLLY